MRGKRTKGASKQIRNASMNGMASIAWEEGTREEFDEINSESLGLFVYEPDSVEFITQNAGSALK